MALAKAAEPAYGIARLIGEGYGKPDGKDETPIDVQYGKLAEWLVSHTSLCISASLQGQPPCCEVLCAGLYEAWPQQLVHLCRVSGSTSQLTGENVCKQYKLQQLQK
jgi:hypothetical protein